MYDLPAADNEHKPIIECVSALFLFASVVFSQNENGVSISARSDGSVNVQVMMEELGGGGHQTVAGVQVKGVTAEELMPKVLELAKEQMKESDTDESNPAAGHQEIG